MARKGAMPVPGPTIITPLVGSLGKRKLPLLNETSTLAAAAAADDTDDDADADADDVDAGKEASHEEHMPFLFLLNGVRY
mmetsp:Transcript_35265/g.65336  ORF Transcript_35265/g.65336 Transcript_35265/m.65336 type:complete len:80 (+) Transcript_35265:199-438(+)